MQKDFDMQNKQDERYPVELPSRQNKTESSPIVDVVENEAFPLSVDGTNPVSNQNNASVFEQIADAAAVDIIADTENISAAELFK